MSGVWFEIWFPDGSKTTYEAASDGAGFDLADEMGAVWLRNGYGWRFRKLEGEWVHV